MTCIVALIQDGSLWVAGDASGVAGSKMSVRADPKVFSISVPGYHRGRDDTPMPMLIGYTSSFRMAQILRYRLEPPPRLRGQSTFDYLASDFADAVRTCLTDGGYTRIDNRREEGGQFLIAYDSGIFGMEYDFAISHPADSFDAVGSGEMLAHGALYATPTRAPEARIETALRAAHRFNTDVRGPFFGLRITSLDEVEPISFKGATA